MRPSCWGLLLVVPLTALAQGREARASKPVSAAVAPRRVATPGVNWEGQVLRATGAGAPDLKAANPSQARLGAERSAKADAYRTLLERVRVLHVSADRSVGDEMARDDVRLRVEEAIRGYKVVAKRFFSDSGVELDVEVPLAVVTAALVESSAEAVIAFNGAGTRKYTGLVVDARGLGVKPVLAPRLLDASGKAVYGAAALPSQARGSTGVAAWFDDLDAAKRAALVGEKPMVVKATGAKGSDLVLAADDVKTLGEVDTRFLSEGRVVIVLQ
ncbi:LPP20 family lipoprotein [Myxococcus stipitatus]|uniref:LPP20 family lipoprotein n=1 Tax=Myxococcus stipitatus TaxID=83455 RepID=UPI001F33124D|nr:LPP20 family lipoprotein [Myxococcus stipitatus]MCE9671239.1 LPP20 family lipoprotein [Myxococcus stipitatus]